LKYPQPYIILFLFLVVGLSSNAQNYTNYTEKDGLVSDFVYRGLQDKEGFIWFITDKGISKFDGKTFKNFTVKEGLPVNEIWHIRITPDDRVWYFTRSDRLGYIKNDSVYSFFSSNRDMMNPSGKILQSGNNIAIVSGGFTYHFKDTIWKAEKNENGTTALLNTPIKIGYKQNQNETVINKDGTVIHEFKRFLGSPNVYQYSDSLLVFCSANNYDIVNLKNEQIKSETTPSLLRASNTRTNVWMNLVNDKFQLSANEWLFTFDESIDQTASYLIPAHLGSTQSFKDRDGFIWVCTSFDGLYKLPIHYQNFTHFFNGNVISKISEVDGQIYFGVEGDAIYKLVDDQPQFWAKATTTIYDISKLEDTVVAVLWETVYLETDGVLHTIPTDESFSFGRNLINYHGSYFTEGFSGVSKNGFAERTKKVYNAYSSYQGLFKKTDSLFVFNFKKMLYYKKDMDRFTAYKDVEIGSKVILAKTHGDRTYIATEGDGLYLFSFGNLTKLIPSDQAIVGNISIENSNSIWAVSEGSLLHYERKEDEPFSVKKYSQINGFPTNNVIDVLIFNNHLYIGSSEGLTIINTDDISESENYALYVKEVSVNGKKLSKDSVSLRYNSGVNLKVNFGVVNFFDTENDILQYRLSPDQEKWTTTASGEVNLYDLKPKDYQLILKVKQFNSEKTIQLPIIIKPLWWQRNITKAVFILLVLAMVGFLLFQYRKHELSKKLMKIQTQKKLAEYELHALRSQMNPHFVFNSLAAIQYYINENDFVNSEKYLVKFSQLVRRFFELTKEEEISVAQEISLLTNYLEIEKLRFKDKLNFEFIIDEYIDAESTIIPTMLLQPVVENAVNHGIFNKEENGNITIVFKYLNWNKLGVEIIDDGVGFANTKKPNDRKINSSLILSDRLFFLNQSDKWEITYTTEEAFSEGTDRGNKAIFTIKTLK